MRINKGMQEMGKVQERKNEWAVLQRADGIIMILMPEIPPSQNVYLRWHWAKRKKYLDELSLAFSQLRLSLRGYKPFQKAEVKISYYFKDRRIRDIDNYNGKFILDALKKANFITDDNSEVLSLPEPKLLLSKEFPRTEIMIISKDNMKEG